MPDQASELRELVRRGGPSARGASPPRPKLLVLSGGRPGVGTTTIAVGLAAALAHLRHRTLLVDAAPEARAATLLSAEAHEASFHLRTSPARPESRLARPTGFAVLYATSEASANSQAAEDACAHLIRQLKRRDAEADFVVIDAGDGVRRSVRQFWEAADMVLLVTTPEPDSVMDAYVAVKLLSAGLASGAGRSAGVHTVVNKASRRMKARGVHARLAQACRRFLHVDLSAAGFVADDPRLGGAGRAGEPDAIPTPSPRTARQIRRLARTAIHRTKGTAVTT